MVRSSSQTTLASSAPRTISQKTHAALMSLSRESNGEVEGPTDVAGRAQVERSSLVPARAADQAPRAHTVFRRPRRQTDHVSRTPRTIVRSHPHRSPLCACGTAPATEATLLPPELSAPKGRTRTPVAPSEDAYKTAESAT